MRIVCESCGTAYRIPREKLTRSVHRATCKRCGHKIVIRLGDTAASEHEIPPIQEQTGDSVKLPRGSDGLPIDPAAAALGSEDGNATSDAALAGSVGSSDSALQVDVGSSDSALAADVGSSDRALGGDVGSSDPALAGEVSSSDPALAEDVSSSDSALAADVGSSAASLAEDVSSSYPLFGRDIGSSASAESVDAAGPSAQAAESSAPRFVRANREPGTGPDPWSIPADELPALPPPGVEPVSVTEPGLPAVGTPTFENELFHGYTAPEAPPPLEEALGNSLFGDLNATPEPDPITENPVPMPELVGDLPYVAPAVPAAPGLSTAPAVPAGADVVITRPSLRAVNPPPEPDSQSESQSLDLSFDDEVAIDGAELGSPTVQAATPGSAAEFDPSDAPTTWSLDAAESGFLRSPGDDPRAQHDDEHQTQPDLPIASVPDDAEASLDDEDATETVDSHDGDAPSIDDPDDPEAPNAETAPGILVPTTSPGLEVPAQQKPDASFGVAAFLGVVGSVALVLAEMGLVPESIPAAIPMGAGLAGCTAAIGIAIPTLRSMGPAVFILFCVIVGGGLGALTLVGG